MAVEHATFTPLVFTIKGVMGKECSIYKKALAEKLATKSGDRFSEVTRLMIRVKLFIILKYALQCIRGYMVTTSPYRVSQTRKLRLWETLPYVTTLVTT